MSTPTKTKKTDLTAAAKAKADEQAKVVAQAEQEAEARREKEQQEKDAIIALKAKDEAKAELKASTPKDKVPEEVGSEEHEVLVRMAEEAATRRKSIPASVRSAGLRECPRKKQMKQFIGPRAEKGPNGEDPEVLGFYIDNTRTNRLTHAGRGAKPVIFNGEWITCDGGDLLMEKDYQFHRQELEDSKKMSDAQESGATLHDDTSEVAEGLRKEGDFTESHEKVEGLTAIQVAQAMKSSEGTE